MKRAVLVIALALVVQGCATPYKPRGLTGGYSETRLSPNTFRVKFSGNNLTRSDRAIDFALLRSAELTLEHGYKYFVVTDQRREDNYTGVYGPTTGVYFPGNYLGLGWYNTTYVAHPSVSMTILCHKEKPDSDAHDAEFIYNEIRRKYKL